MQAGSLDFGSWPPPLSPAQVEALALYATSYAISHGLLYLPPADRQPRVIPSAAIHAPISLFPSLFPRKLFELTLRLQKTFNVLYARIAMDDEFLDQIMGAETGVGKVDAFIGSLWTGWKQLRDEGLVQPLHLGLFRSDYLLHSPSNESLSIKQVEFNTISVSFGSLSQRTAELHRYLLEASQYYASSPYLRPENFPANNTIAGLSEGLVKAHEAYNVEEYVSASLDSHLSFSLRFRSRILFVVQSGERNVFDQRLLEYELLEKYSIKVIRQTFDELSQSASVNPTTSVLQISCSPDLHPGGFVEISTVYFRSGYTPDDYPTPRHYSTRFLLERSKAIKCPTIALQLAGGKKVQEVLTQPGVLERFLSDKKYEENVFGEHEIKELRASFMGMWGLDVREDMLTPDYIKSGREEFGVRKARECAMSLVLKPQREGGGNNIYKEAIPKFLDALAPQERQAWIAMELIEPPKDTGNYLIRARVAESDSQAVTRTDVVSELGIYGWALFGGDGPSKRVEEKQVGWLVRTKGKENNEGGVASGFSVLDSLLLVD